MQDPKMLMQYIHRTANGIADWCIYSAQRFGEVGLSEMKMER